ncbi:MAG: tetratricopeptide (TPR) repeat protein [Neolewinella sp.]|jgi:tetratricopeptide (TPR) repeat protein
MFNRPFGFVLVLLAATGCQATPGSGVSVSPGSVPASASMDPSQADAPVADMSERNGLSNTLLEGDSPGQAELERTPSQAAQAVQATFRQVWQQPSFQRDLAESYLRGSEVEPQLTRREAQFRTEILDLIGKQNLVDATSRLQSLQGNNAVFDFMLGNIYFGQNQFPEAVLEYSKAVAQMSNFRRAWQNLALAQMRNGQFEAARDAFVRVISLGGSKAQTYGFLGMMHAQTGDYVAAESALRMVMMMQPDEERWRMMLAQALFQQGKFGDGASLAGVLLTKNPNRADLWLLQANAFVGMKETKRAAENLEIVEQLGGSTYDSLSLLGNIYFNDGALDLAVDAYLRAIAIGKDRDHRPVLAVANRLAGLSAYAESKRLVEGLEATYGARMEMAARTSLRKLQARLAMAAGATDEQVALLQKIVVDDPLDGDALMQLGRHFRQVGEIDTAILRYEQAAQNEKFGAEARVLHAQLLIAESRFAEALPLLRQAQGIKRREDVQKLLDYVERAASRGNG